MSTLQFEDGLEAGRTYLASNLSRQGKPLVFSLEEHNQFLRGLSGIPYTTRLASLVVSTYENRIDATVDYPPFMLDFGELYLKNIIDIGKQLLQARKHVRDESSVTEERRQEIRRLLHEYSCAINDYEGMLRRKLHWTTNESPVAQILDAVVGDGLRIDKEAGRLFRGWRTRREIMDSMQTSRKQQWKARVDRFTMAIVGGVLLVVPVVVMSFDTSRTRSLVTLSVSVLIFPVVIATGAAKASTQEIVGATAAYAAVLAVFLGASTSSSTGGIV